MPSEGGGSRRDGAAAAVSGSAMGARARRWSGRRSRVPPSAPTTTTGTPRVSRYSIVAGTSRIAFGPAHTTATGVRASSSRSEETSQGGGCATDGAAMNAADATGGEDVRSRPRTPRSSSLRPSWPPSRRPPALPRDRACRLHDVPRRPSATTSSSVARHGSDRRGSRPSPAPRPPPGPRLRPRARPQRSAARAGRD